MRAVVIGGGLAGITAATALAQAGHQVTLLEAKPRLGGATMSFTRDGLVIDTGQHVFLRCCTAYRGLLDRLGMAAHAPLQPRFDVTVVSPQRTARLRRRRLPAPFHFMTALLGYPFLNFSERSRISRAALGFKRLDEQDPKTDELRLGDWLEAHGQDDRTRRVLWDLFSVSSLNVPGDDASLALAAVVVKTGLLGDAGAADIGVPALSLGELHGTAAARLLDTLGATVRLSAKVAAIEEKDGEFIVRLGNGVAKRSDDDQADPDAPESDDTGSAGNTPHAGNTPQAGNTPHAGNTAHVGNTAHADDTADADADDILADAVVLAVPHDQAARLIPPGALSAETVDGWAGLGAAPIVNLHVRYDRKVMDVPFAAAVDSPLQWVFDRTRISGMHARGDDGQYLAVSLSAADEYVNLTVAELREKFVPALAEVFPAARQAQVTEFFVTRERRATFRQVPGTASLRPKSATALPGLVLAGAWTDTGWPDTMESAVRSGLNAVIALHESLTPSASGAPQAPPAPSASAAPYVAPDASASSSAPSPSSSESGTKDEISGFVPVRGSAPEVNSVLEVNGVDEHEREVRS